MALKDWSTTDADNDDADLSNNIDWREGQTPGTVNNSARGLMTVIKEWWDDILEGTYFVPAANVSVTSNAYTLTTGQGIGSLKAGLRICFIAEATNTDAVTVNVDTLGATAVKSHGDPLASGAISNGDFVLLVHDGTDFELVYPRRQIGVDFELVNDDAGASGGPVLTLYRNSASPAANDVLGRVDFAGEDSAGNKTTYGQIFTDISDPSNGSEDSRMYFKTQVAGSGTTIIVLGQGLSTPNATGGDKGADTINASELYEDGVRISGQRATTLTASTSANLSWTSIPSGAKRIIIRLRNLDPATNDTDLIFTTTVGGTRQTGAGDYQYSVQVWQGTDAVATSGSTSATQIPVAFGPSGFGVSNAFSGVTGTIILENPTSTSLHKHVSFHTQYIRGGSNELRVNVGSGVFESNSAVDGFDLRMDSGNITAGDVDVYVEY